MTEPRDPITPPPLPTQTLPTQTPPAQTPPAQPLAAQPLAAQTAEPVVLREPVGARIPPVPRETPQPVTARPTPLAPATTLSEPVALPAEWRGRVEPDEKIVWHGQDGRWGKLRGRSGPAQTSRFARGSVTSAIVMIAFSLFWMGAASRGGGIIWLVGLFFLYKGVQSLRAALRGGDTAHHDIGRAQSGEGAATGTQYLLTNKAAYIKRSPTDLERIEITPMMRMTLHKTSVLFAVRKGPNGRTDVPYGFENIDNAAEVFAMMRGIEREAR